MNAIVNDKLAAGQTAVTHRFEAAGLGKAPFRFTGSVTEKTFCECQGAPVRPGSTCDFCGTCIRYEFWVRSACGNEFKVGCDCIHKTGDRGLILQIAKAERELRDKKNAAAKAKNAAKLQARIEAAVAKLPSVRGTLAAQPHPTPYFAAEGRTMLDYVHWCLANRASEKAANIIERA